MRHASSKGTAWKLAMAGLACLACLSHRSVVASADPAASLVRADVLVMDDTVEPSVRSERFVRHRLADGLEGSIRSIAREADGPVWMGYAMPLIPSADGVRRMCCGSWDRDGGRGACCGLCVLQERGYYIASDDDEKPGVSITGPRAYLEGSPWYFVVFRVDRGRIDRVRGFSADCELDAGGLAFHWLIGVTPTESLAWLESLVVAPDPDDDVIDGGIAAISFHDDPGADRSLERLTRDDHPRSIRETAAFWLGINRGRAGYEMLSRLARTSDRHLRKKVIFALSQSEVPEATERIVEIAHGDRDPDVRGEALFWLAQEAAARAAEAITEAIERDPETDVKRRAVFALSQLPADQAVPLLIDVARRHRNPAVRKEAIFWLGQTDDPRALTFIEEVLGISG